VNKTVAAAVSAFGAGAEAKLSAIFPGAPEDQLRSPLEVLVRDLSEIAGLPEGAVHLIGETSLADIKTRPDFAVTVHKALVGFIEVKAPGKGADPRRFSYPHDKDQWEKLKSLPNLIYTDGNAFSCGAMASSKAQSFASKATSKQQEPHSPHRRPCLDY
jgi:hypothetical protein